MFRQKYFELFISRSLSGVQLCSPAEGGILRLLQCLNNLLDTRFYPFENNCQRHGIRRLVCHQHVLKNKEIFYVPPLKEVFCGCSSASIIFLCFLGHVDDIQASLFINSSKYFCRNMNNFHLAHVSKKISKKIHVMVSNTIHEQDGSYSCSGRNTLSYL
jgi:hypothetical protein